MRPVTLFNHQWARVINPRAGRGEYHGRQALYGQRQHPLPYYQIVWSRAFTPLHLLCRSVHREVTHYMYSLPTFYFDDPKIFDSFLQLSRPCDLRAITSLSITCTGDDRQSTPDVSVLPQHPPADLQAALPEFTITRLTSLEYLSLTFHGRPGLRRAGVAAGSSFLNPVVGFASIPGSLDDDRKTIYTNDAVGSHPTLKHVTVDLHTLVRIPLRTELFANRHTPHNGLPTFRQALPDAFPEAEWTRHVLFVTIAHRIGGRLAGESMVKVLILGGDSRRGAARMYGELAFMLLVRHCTPAAVLYRLMLDQCIGEALTTTSRSALIKDKTVQYQAYNRTLMALPHGVPAVDSGVVRQCIDCIAASCVKGVYPLALDPAIRVPTEDTGVTSHHVNEYIENLLAQSSIV